MPDLLSDDTIAAAATPPGPGGIAVVRVSGPAALAVLRALFLPADASANISFRPRYMHYGHVRDKTGAPLDEVLAVYMPGPHSATGEDVAEVHCHGGTAVVAVLLEAAFAAGARPAGPGEFTRRAFLNGRIDLAQAEAVAELIAAPSHEGIRFAKAKLEGALSAVVRDLRASLDALRIQITLAVDFPEEEAELLSHVAFADVVNTARARIAELLAAFRRARLWREGAQAVLAGRVNAGKSSLLNAFLGRRRSIVSDQPGTTRDYIEESVSLGGLPVRMIDTAGLRESGDIVEAEGMRLTGDLAGAADLILLVVDSREGIRGEEREFLAAHSEAAALGKIFCVLNKMDCIPSCRAGEPPTRADLEALLYTGAPSGGESGIASGAESGAGSGTETDAAFAALLQSCPLYAVSAANGDGLDALQTGIRNRLLTGPASGGALAASSSGGHPGREADGGDIAPNLRQAHLLESALWELDALAEDAGAAMPPEILGVRLEAATAFLDEITGTSSGEELLDRIFSSFCIGK